MDSRQFRQQVRCQHCGQWAVYRRVRRWKWGKDWEWWEYHCSHCHQPTEGTGRFIEGLDSKWI